MLRPIELVAIFIATVTLSLCAYAWGWSLGAKDVKQEFISECVSTGFYTDRKLLLECTPLIHIKNQV